MASAAGRCERPTACRGHEPHPSAGAPLKLREPVWVVPNNGLDNSGNGFLLDNCKFGNENLGPDDYRVLIADESSGTYFGGRMPNLSTDSSGYVTGHRYRDCSINGNGTYQNPFIYSTASKFQGSYNIRKVSGRE